MRTTRFTSIAAILAAPILALGQAADGRAGGTSNPPRDGSHAACARQCDCQAAREGKSAAGAPANAKAGETAEVPEWVRQIWSSP